MNILSKIVITSDENTKEKIISMFNFVNKKTHNSYEIYEKISSEINKILIYSKNLENIWEYISQNYDVVKLYIIWVANPIDTVDLRFWDVVLPNCILNDKNEMFFLENLVDKNYDLKIFWLVLNWICLTKENIKDDEELNEIRLNFTPDIVDKDSFYIVKNLKTNNIENIFLIKEIWEETKNALTILELMW